MIDLEEFYFVKLSYNLVDVLIKGIVLEVLEDWLKGFKFLRKLEEEWFVFKESLLNNEERKLLDMKCV